MSLHSAEQIARDRHGSAPRKARRIAKQRLARWNRRQARRNPEEAPRKHQYTDWIG